MFVVDGLMPVLASVDNVGSSVNSVSAGASVSASLRAAVSVAVSATMPGLCSRLCAAMGSAVASTTSLLPAVLSVHAESPGCCGSTMYGTSGSLASLHGR